MFWSQIHKHLARRFATELSICFIVLILHYYFVFFSRCRRVIVILSRGFENSEYCDFALKLAQSLSPGKLLFICTWVYLLLVAIHVISNWITIYIELAI